MGTEPKMRTKRYLQNHVVYQRTEMILLRNPLASPVRGARQNGHAIAWPNVLHALAM